MDVRLQEDGPTKRVLEVQLDPEEVGRHIEEVAGEFQKRVTLPGFRKGKVPRSILESRFAGAIREEALERAVNQAYQTAIAEKKLVPLSSPFVDNIRYDKDQPLAFRVAFEVRPEIEAKDFRNVSLTKRIREIADEDVDRTLERIQEESARYPDVDRAATENDVVIVDHVRVDEKGRTLKSSRVRNARLELGADALLPDFKIGLEGASAGESRTVEVHYPEDFGNKELAGKKAKFHIKVKKVQEKKIPDLDDNLAKQVFGIETLTELRDRIRGQLEAEEERRARREMEEQAVEALLQKNAVPIPEKLAERLTNEALGRSGTQVEQLPEEQRAQLLRGYRQAVERRIAREWLLDSIARQEKIEVSSQEVGEEMAKLATAQGQIGSEFRSLSPQERQTKIHDALMEKKIFDLLIEQAEIKEEKITESHPAVAT